MKSSHVNKFSSKYSSNINSGRLGKWLYNGKVTIMDPALSDEKYREFIVYDFLRKC